ncbi:LysE family translocator [Entomomonas asaccharolytica]|uniref:LysE family transporter n=1 Tax=Entomomonas asaccharolytica TaxID=2785331 RepID=A0A974NGE5_9GAMM|nr:LysE family transporter [Entomomonas asaccharolytica]QQP86173.1 LysE family transporter [Entomomonas asaccharolytica]
MEIFIYAFAITYTPGPVNITSLIAGLNNYTKQSIKFCLGVSIAMFITFIILGYLGELFITPKLLPYISLIGSCYILYLSIKILKNTISFDKSNLTIKLNFWSGLIMQFLNPKNITAVIPITTIMFPTSNIIGIKILIVSLCISLFGGGAPLAYSIIGSIIKNKITNHHYFSLFNKMMGILLFISGIFMFYDFYKYIVN